jgi:hypothetical protein
VTEVNGLRLAYRGFIAGLIGAYVWVAIAMFAAVLGGAPLEPLLTVGSLGQGGAEVPATRAFVVGLALAQVVGGGVGIAFAYFFARFFTVRGTLGMAAVCVAVLAWAILSNRLAVAAGLDPWSFGTSIGLLVATVAYGGVLGSSVPVRSDVSRYSGSPST